MSQIVEIKARQILDSRGKPTIETEVYTNRGVVAKASVPSEVFKTDFTLKELRDNDPGKYSGQGVLRAVANINKLINEELRGHNLFNQSSIDAALIELDGTGEKTNTGVNAILSVSLAVAKAAAISTGQSLFRYIGGINANTLPIPMINVLENVSFKEKKPEIKEFMIMPVGFDQFSEALRAGAEVNMKLIKLLSDDHNTINKGATGGVYTELKSNTHAIEILIKAIEGSGYKAGEQVMLGIDANAAEYYDSAKKNYIYQKQGTEVSSEELMNYWEDICQNYPVVSVEDPLHYNDWESWQKFTERMGDKVQIAGDDFFAGNPERFMKAVEGNVGNSLFIKPIQIGTVTEILNMADLAKKSMYNTIFASSPSETDDLSTVELSVALNAGIVKIGAFSNADANIKYNRLTGIEEELGNSGKYGNN